MYANNKTRKSNKIQLNTRQNFSAIEENENTLDFDIVLGCVNHLISVLPFGIKFGIRYSNKQIIYKLGIDNKCRSLYIKIQILNQTGKYLTTIIKLENEMADFDTDEKEENSIAFLGEKRLPFKIKIGSY